jgi:hypothetical protein
MRITGNAGWTLDNSPKLVNWGDISDPYYGGRYYGEMLMAVAPAMRAADPQVVIWLGGLLLIIFGLHIMGVITIPIFNVQKKIPPDTRC